MEIRIENIQKKYGKQTVLDGVSFSAVSGECIGILGDNGCGKSTLLTILAGVQRADGGAFLCDGVDMLQNPSQRAKTVGYVPQGVPLLEELTAWDNLLLWYDKATLLQELDHGILKMLGINEFLKKTVSHMSGGMKKRLSIGCSVASHPTVLLLDEPMAALDLSCKKNIFDYISAQKKAGGIVLLVTHDVLEFSLCDRCYHIADGKLEPFDTSNQITEFLKR
ncbi:MAG: ABC transporter ATP-binding protein [Clostridia bacterium]|nr:ABC transporter ATP-binding protein [Clostridia bacterium]